MLTKESRIRNVYNNPVGRDIIRKILLQMGRSDRIINNPIVGSLRLKAIPRLTMGYMDQEFLETFIALLNSEPDTPKKVMAKQSPPGGRRQFFIRFTPEAFRTVMEMVSVI